MTTTTGAPWPRAGWELHEHIDLKHDIRGYGAAAKEAHELAHQVDIFRAGHQHFHDEPLFADR